MSKYAALLVALFGSALSFAPESDVSFRRRNTHHHQNFLSRERTSLDLLPGQGNQLAAAVNAGIALKKKPIRRHQGTLTSIRNVFKQIISLHSLFRSRRKESKAPNATWSDGFPSVSAAHDHDDAVFYPLIGFEYVSSNDGEVAVFATTSRAACRIHTAKQDEEEIVGWFTSKYCPLDIDAEDFCQQPK